MDERPRPRLTIPEILVIFLILGALCTGTFCGPHIAMVKGYQTQMLSHMKQLHLATQQMALDGTTRGETNLGWPGDTGGSFSRWASNLVKENYLSSADLHRLLAEPKAPPSAWSPRQIWRSLFGPAEPAPVTPSANTNAVLVYAVAEATDGQAVFLSSANFTNTPTGGLPSGTNAVPFGAKGFVIFHKGGDGLILQNRQIGPAYTNIIGSYVPLCR